MTQRQAAEALNWSPSKLLRIEGGAVGVSVTDTRALLTSYGVTDEILINELQEMAREARRPAWWAQYRDVVTPEYLTYLSYEGAASVVRSFQPSIVPELLQTEIYARAVLQVQDKAEDRLRLRLEQQERILQPGAREFYFLPDEAVIRRVVGNVSTMRAQRQRLLTLNEMPNVTIKIVMFSAGLYPQFKAPYVIFELEGDELVAYTENPEGESITIERRLPYRGKLLPSDYLGAFWQVEHGVAEEVSPELLEGRSA